MIISMVRTHGGRQHILRETIDVKLPLMEHKIDRVIAVEAATGLAREPSSMRPKRSDGLATAIPRTQRTVTIFQASTLR